MTSWQTVLEALRTQPPGTEWWSGIDEHVHPSGVPRMRLSAGEGHGQLCDYRMLDQTSGGCLHVRVYADHYVSHFDRVDPSLDLAGHLARDCRRKTS